MNKDTRKDFEMTEKNEEAAPLVRSNELLADDNNLAYFLADGVLSILEVNGRTVAARMILQAIDSYKANIPICVNGKD